MASAYRETAKVFKAFCDENRLQILSLLRSGEKCACTLLEDLQISQSTLSHHMKILCDAGVVQGRREGKWVHYSIDPSGAARAGSLLKEQVTLDPVQQPNSCCAKEPKAI
ncbi:MAG: ArsR/SmtB family transcription factor [Evtepia sp.]